MSRMVSMLSFGCSIALAGATYEQEDALSMVQMQVKKQLFKADEDGDETETSGVVTSASHWGASSTCTVTDDTFFSVFDGGKTLSLLQADIDTDSDTDAGFLLKDIIDHDGEGKDMWLVRGRAHDDSTVRIAARYWRDVSAKGHQVFLKSLAVSGGFITNRTLIIRPMQDAITWNNKKETYAILQKENSTFNVEGLINATRKTYSRLVGGEWQKDPSVEVQLPKGMKMIITRQQKYVNVAISMPPLAIQDGLCGNFNGDASDDTLKMIRSRGPTVKDHNSMFPAEWVPPRNSQVAQTESKAILEEGETNHKVLDDYFAAKDNHKVLDDWLAAKPQADEAPDNEEKTAAPTAEELAAESAMRSNQTTGEDDAEKLAAVAEEPVVEEAAAIEQQFPDGQFPEVPETEEELAAKPETVEPLAAETPDAETPDAEAPATETTETPADEAVEEVDADDASELDSGLAAEILENTTGKTDWRFDEKIKDLVAAHPKLPSVALGNGNCIGNDGSHSLQELSELKSLTIGDHNGISSKAFGNLPKLTSLTLGSTNHFDAGAYMALAKLTDLTSLTIGSKNQFGRDAICETWNTIHEESNATELFSKPRDLVKEEYKAFAMAKELAHVETLFVGEKNCIGVDGAKVFGSLRRLKSLNIGSKNNIGVDGAEAFGTLEKLTTLSIGSGNAFGPAGYRALMSLTKLTSLIIGDKNSFGVDHDKDVQKRQEEFKAQCHKAHQEGEEVEVEDDDFASEEEEDEAVVSLQEASSCTIADDPIITVFDGETVSLLQATDMHAFMTSSEHTADMKVFDMLSLEDGETQDVWVVRGKSDDGKSVNIQARYMRNDSMPDRQLFVKALAIGGDFIDNNLLVLRPLQDSITWTTPHGKCSDILVDQKSRFKIKGLLKAKRGLHAKLVEDPSVDNPGVEVKTRKGVKLIINRQQHSVNVIVSMPPLQSQDGLCGNFNGDSDDDTLEMIEERNPRVADGQSMFPTA